MKVAIAVDGEHVSQHFGRCERYEVVELNGEEMVGRQALPNPGQEPGRLPRMLNELGVDTVIAGGIGRRAQDMFLLFGIVTLTGVSGPVGQALERLAAGELKDGESTCEH
ncbi:MAG: NifB/NifX family molybdenum-iron cluster-binding protein [Armatimonadota bacterium]